FNNSLASKVKFHRDLKYSAPNELDVFNDLVSFSVHVTFGINAVNDRYLFHPICLGLAPSLVCWVWPNELDVDKLWTHLISAASHNICITYSITCPLEEIKPGLPLIRVTCYHQYAIASLVGVGYSNGTHEGAKLGTTVHGIKVKEFKSASQARIHDQGLIIGKNLEVNNKMRFYDIEIAPMISYSSNSRENAYAEETSNMSAQVKQTSPGGGHDAHDFALINDCTLPLRQNCSRFPLHDS
ncbi:hypothetical protein KI387_004253, partial [Taxus chinensis]